MFLYTGNLLHHSVLPETFTTSLSQNVHSGGNIFVVYFGSLQGDRDVEASHQPPDYVSIVLSFW